MLEFSTHNDLFVSSVLMIKLINAIDFAFIQCIGDILSIRCSKFKMGKIVIFAVHFKLQIYSQNLLAS